MFRISSNNNCFILVHQQHMGEKIRMCVVGNDHNKDDANIPKKIFIIVVDNKSLLYHAIDQNLYKML